MTSINRILTIHAPFWGKVHRVIYEYEPVPNTAQVVDLIRAQDGRITAFPQIIPASELGADFLDSLDITEENLSSDLAIELGAFVQREIGKGPQPPEKKLQVIH